jgi:hypothetical protein
MKARASGADLKKIPNSRVWLFPRVPVFDGPDQILNGADYGNGEDSKD